MLRETTLTPAQLILPMFVLPGEGRRDPIGALPGVHHRVTAPGWVKYPNLIAVDWLVSCRS